MHTYSILNTRYTASLPGLLVTRFSVVQLELTSAKSWGERVSVDMRAWVAENLQMSSDVILEVWMIASLSSQGAAQIAKQKAAQVEESSASFKFRCAIHDKSML